MSKGLEGPKSHDNRVCVLRHCSAEAWAVGMPEETRQ